MKYEHILEADFVTLKLVGTYVPPETEPHGEYVDEHFEGMDVWLLGKRATIDMASRQVVDAYTETDITDKISQKQYEELEGVLMQEWRNR